MNKKQKIFFVINDFLIGGAQKLFIEIANKIQDEGEYQIVLVSLFNFKDKKDLIHYISKDIECVHINFKTVYNVFGWYRYFRTLQKHKPHSIFSTLFFANVITRIVSLIFGPKIFVVEQNTYDMKSHFHIFIDEVLAHLTPYIICTSKSVADFIIKQTSINKEKFVVIHSGVDRNLLISKIDNLTKIQIRERLNLPKERFIFLSLARLTAQKNPQLLIESFSQFLSKMTNPHKYFLLMVGGGLIKNDLEKLVRDFKIEDQVYFVGAVHDVWNYYAASDVFVSTSRIEGFSLVHAEAMVFGLPLVTTKTAGPDIMLVPEKNGFFVEPNIGSVVDGMKKITEVNYDEYSQYSKMRAQDFTIEKTAEQYRNFIKQHANIR